jgi:pseudaminic acid synthase
VKKDYASLIQPGGSTWSKNMLKFQGFSKEFQINGQSIGPNHPPYIVAELSGNHQGDINKALELIDKAAGTGANAIKIQTYTPDTITLNHDGPEFMIKGGLWKNRTLYNLYAEAYTPWEWHPALFARAKKHNITLFSSPFDDSAVDLLESLDCPAYKIASFEITDIGLIKKVASTGKPVIISTGLATLSEIEEAVETVWDSGGRQLVVLHCISGYPTPIDDCHLQTITDLKKHFSFPIGLSDHTIDHIASVTAVALGARLIEKHFKLDDSDNSVDAAFSLDPQEFATLVAEAHRAYRALGHAEYGVKASEGDGRMFRRSLYIVKDIKKGDILGPEHVRSVRPGLGLHPRYLPKILGVAVTRDLKFGTPLSKKDIDTSLKE